MISAKELLAASSQPKTFKRSYWKRAQLKVKCPPTNRAAKVSLCFAILPAFLSDDKHESLYSVVYDLLP